MKWIAPNEPSGGEADYQAEDGGNGGLPDRTPKDGYIGPFDFGWLVPEQATIKEELVVRGERKFPDDAAAKFLGEEGVDQHHANRQHEEEADD